MKHTKFTNLFPNVAYFDGVFNHFDEFFTETKSKLDGPRWQEVKTSLTKAPVDYDVTSDEKLHTLTLVVPGLTKEAVSVTISDGKLNVKVEAGDSLWVRSSDRKFTLPEDIDLENLDANVVDGILTVKSGKTVDVVKEITVL